MSALQLPLATPPPLFAAAFITALLFVSSATSVLPIA